MRTLLSWLLPACAAVSAASLGGACGAHVVVDGTSATSGGGGTGGTSSSSATASSTGATASSTSVSSSSSGGGGCPAPFPGVEAVCDQEGEVCPVPGACCDGQAVCKGGFWTFEGPFCNQPCTQDCGPDGFSCQAGKVCVTLLEKITIYQCADSPCPQAGLACSCAASLCEAEGLVCNNIQGGFKVLCDCNGACN